jgi:glycerol-3-phosphate dehydrogenase
MGRVWTAGVALPGGDFPMDVVGETIHQLTTKFLFLTARWAKRLLKAYGNEAFDVLGAANLATDLGEDFGATLTAREVAWLIDKEFAQTAEDVIWRRSKLGLRLTDAQIERLQSWIHSRLDASPAAQVGSHD